MDTENPETPAELPADVGALAALHVEATAAYEALEAGDIAGRTAALDELERITDAHNTLAADLAALEAREVPALNAPDPADTPTDDGDAAPVATDELPAVPEGTEIPDDASGISVDEFAALQARIGALETEAAMSSGTESDTTNPNPGTPSDGGEVRKASFEFVGTQKFATEGAVGSNEDLSRALNRAARSGGDTPMLVQRSFDPSGDDVMRADTTQTEVNRLLGINVETGQIERAAIGCADQCGPILESQDCLDAASPVSDKIQSVAMDGCSVRVRKYDPDSDPKLFTFVHCFETPEGEFISGLQDAEGNVTPIDAANEESWKPLNEIKGGCEYEVFTPVETGMVVKIGRNADICSPENVQRTLNRWMGSYEKRRDAVLMTNAEAIALNRGFVFEGGGAVAGEGAADTVSAVLADAMPILECATDCDVTFDCAFVVSGAEKWMNARTREGARMRDMLAECGVNDIVGYTPLDKADNPFYQPVTPGAPITGLGAPAPKDIKIVLMNSGLMRQGRTPELRIGFTDQWRDFDLARQNCRGVFFESGSTLIPLGDVPLAVLTVTACNSGMNPGYYDASC